MKSFTEHLSSIFTSDELKIIRLICQQYFNDEIAKELSISLRTVEVSQKALNPK